MATATAAPRTVSLTVAPRRVPREKPLFERMRRGARIALFLERLRLKSPEVRAGIGEERWRRFVGEVYAWLYDLRDAYDRMWEK